MRNRLKVLTSQSEYNQFRSRYQTEKIERHQQIHEEAVKERQVVASSLQARSHSKVQERKANNEKLRSELKEKLSEVFGRMKLERAEQSEEVKLASLKNRELLAKRRQQQLERKKSQHEEVVKMEAQIKEVVGRHRQERQMDVSSVKSCEKDTYLHYSREMAKQLQELAKQEEELISINSESQSASRILSQQYNELYTRKHTRSFQLPSIRKVKNKQANTTTTETR